MSVVWEITLRMQEAWGQEELTPSLPEPFYEEDGPQAFITDKMSVLDSGQAALAGRDGPGLGSDPFNESSFSHSIT